jgi:hypothetical protein
MGFLFDQEHGRNRLLLNVVEFLPAYTTSYPRSSVRQIVPLPITYHSTLQNILNAGYTLVACLVCCVDKMTDHAERKNIVFAKSCGSVAQFVPQRLLRDPGDRSKMERAVIKNAGRTRFPSANCNSFPESVQLLKLLALE